MTDGHRACRKFPRLSGTAPEYRHHTVNKEERKIRERTLRSVALNCFATEKWEDVSVARIAKLAGVAKGTVYLHFASKDEICARLALEFYDELQQKYLQITGTGSEQLKQLISTSFSHYHERAQYRHVVQICQREHFLVNLDPELAGALQSSRQFQQERIAVALTKGMRDKTLLPDAGTRLTGICSTLSGALDIFSHRTDTRHENNAHIHLERTSMERTNTNQQSPKEFIENVTSYIISSVENNAEPIAKSGTAIPPLELTLDVQ